MVPDSNLIDDCQHGGVPFQVGLDRHGDADPHDPEEPGKHEVGHIQTIPGRVLEEVVVTLITGFSINDIWSWLMISSLTPTYHLLTSLLKTFHQS